jgi:hypothetical protein
MGWDSGMHFLGSVALMIVWIPRTYFHLSNNDLILFIFVDARPA